MRIFFFKQKTAYEIMPSLVGSEMCIRDRLVDNSIVVMENIYRLRGHGISAPRAAVQGTKQVAAPIVASTLTTISVFLPMVYVTGMISDLLMPFAFTISYALIASLIVAMTVAVSYTHLRAPTRLGMISYAVFCLKKKKI